MACFVKDKRFVCSKGKQLINGTLISSEMASVKAVNRHVTMSISKKFGRK